MKKVILTISALMISAMISTGAMATVPDLIPVQGVLADSADLPIDALTDITFTLYDGESSSTVLWTDTFVDVDVVEGFFTVYLGSDTALDFASLISNSEVWMGITVESDPEMDRVQLATVPFAIEAQICQQVGSLTEADLTPASGIAAGDITNWNNAFGWGDHDAVGYLTSYTETDPDYNSDPASGITAANITNWTTAYGWGSHVGLYAPLVHTHAFGDLTGIPAGLADGDDNTTYTAGTGLDLVGTTFSVDPTDFNGTTPVNRVNNSIDVNVSDGAYHTLDQISFTAPANGRVLLIGTARTWCQANCTAQSLAYVGFTTSSSVAPTFGNAEQFWYSAGVSGEGASKISTILYSQAVTSGSAYTFYLRGNGPAGVTIRYDNENLAYVFIPN